MPTLAVRNCDLASIKSDHIMTSSSFTPTFAMLLRMEDPVFVGERGGKLQNWDRWLKIVARETKVSGWSAHTLRRTAATLAADLGAEPHVISVLLGHKNVGGQLTATYSKSRYRGEHAEALQRLADHIDT